MTLSVTESALETPDATADTELKAEPPWRSLEPERFQVLRLNALPADRETGLRALRFVYAQHGHELMR